MRQYKLIVFVLIFMNCLVYGQKITVKSFENKQSISDIFKTFQDQHKLNFSFDVALVANLKLKFDKEQITIEYLRKVIAKQTRLELLKLDDHSYILIKNDKTITVCGVILDEESTFELSHANIIKDNEIIELSDNKGYFEIEIKPWDFISISHLGYLSKRIKASEFSETVCDTFRLQSTIQKLNEVLINDYLTLGVKKNEDASINVSTKKLKILPGLVEPDVLQSLQLLPGISSPNEDPAGLHIRGGTTDQNLILWDGIKMYLSGHFFNQISSFNPNIVKNVSVYRGGTSVRYGDRVSGVIVIESDDDLTTKFKVGGGLNLTRGDFFIKTPLSKKLGIMIAGRRSTTDFYKNIAFNNLSKKVFQNTRADLSNINKDEIFEDKSRKDDFFFSDINIKLLWNLNAKNKLKLSTIFIENILDNETTFPNSDTNLIVNNKDFLRRDNTGLGLDWKNTFANNTIQKASFYFSFFDSKYSLKRFEVDEDKNFIYNQNNSVKDIGFEYAWDIRLGEKDVLGLGYQYAYNEANYLFNRLEGFGNNLNEFTELNNTNGNNHTIYSEYIYRSSKAYINLGLRNSLITNVNKFFIEPRLFSSIEVFNNFRLTTSAELKNQQLNQFLVPGELDINIEALPVSNDIWIISGVPIDEDLAGFPIVKSRQFTLGSLYTYKGWNFDLEGYYKKLNDISSFNNSELNFTFVDEVFLTGSEERIGLDFLLKKKIQNYRFWLGYSLSKTQVLFDDISEKPFAGFFDQRHVFNFSQSLQWKKFEFAMGWNFASGRPFIELEKNEDAVFGFGVDPDKINVNTLPNYHRLDVSMLYRFKYGTKKTWSGMIGFSVRNLYNRENIIDKKFKAEFDDYADKFIISSILKKSLRITPDLVLRFKF